MKLLIIFSLIYIVNGKVTQCYICKDICDDPLRVEVCPSDGDYICQSSLKINNTSTQRTKGCVRSTATVIEDCKNQNTDVNNTCYTCNKDLCNGNDQKSVSNCYFCNGTCNNPLDSEDCSDSSAGKYYICMASQITINDATTQTRGCYLYNNDVKRYCEDIDKVDGGSCYTCSEDYCNNRNDQDGTRKCYSCKGKCNNPLDIETCPESNVTSFMCLAAVVSKDKTIEETRGCYPNIDDVIKTCTEANVGDNNSCYTCDKDLCNNIDDNKDDNDDGTGSAEIYVTSAFLVVILFIFINYI